MNQGKLFVIEGAGDGCGKSTQLELLKKRLESENIEFFSHHFPTYGTFHGAIVEHYLSGELGNICELSPYFINSLYAIDRAISWQLYLKKEYEKGKYLLLDRYTTSSLIYQVAPIIDMDEKKRAIDYMMDFEYNKLGIKEPDDVIFLSLSFEKIMELMKRRTLNDGVENDIYERDYSFLKRVYDNALFVADYLNWSVVNCERDGKLISREEIHENVYRLVRK